MDKTPPQQPDPSNDDEWPDDCTMIRRGDSDPYLAEIARRSRSASGDESGPGSSSALDWDGHDRRSNGVDCFDPYVVEIARSMRSEF